MKPRARDCQFISNAKKAGGRGRGDPAFWAEKPGKVTASKKGFGTSGKWVWELPGLRGADTPRPETLRPLAEFSPLRADGPEKGGNYPPKGAQIPKGAQAQSVSPLGDDDGGEI